MLNFEMPQDVRNFVLRIQKELKQKKNMKLYSQQLTISHIIREYKKITETRNAKQ